MLLQKNANTNIDVPLTPNKANPNNLAKQKSPKQSSTKQNPNKSLLDTTVYFPDKTPPINTNGTKKKYIPKLDFGNLPKYESPISSQGMQMVQDDDDLIEFNDNNHLITMDEISSITASKKQSGTNLPFVQNDFDIDEFILNTEVVESKQIKKENKASHINIESKQAQKVKVLHGVSHSLINVNEIINNKKFCDLKKLSKNRQFQQSFKTLDKSIIANAVKVKSSLYPEY